MRFTLSCGKNVRVLFDHVYQERTFLKKPEKDDVDTKPVMVTVAQPFKTVCVVEFWKDPFNEDAVETFDGEAKCVKGDNFSKLTGRKISFNKALDGIRLLGYLNKAERKELFNKVFPQYDNSSGAQNEKLNNRYKKLLANNWKESMDKLKKEVESYKQMTWFQKLKYNLSEMAGY